MSSHETPTHTRSRSRRRSRRIPYRTVGAALAVLAVTGTGAFAVLSAWHPAPDVSGVWKDDFSGQLYILDRQGDDYRVAIGDRRAPVLGVTPDHYAGTLKLALRTESGLAVTWTLSPPRLDGRQTVISLDDDGFRLDRLVLQHPVTREEHARLAAMTPDTRIAWAPSFDCATAGTSVRRMICADPELASREIKVDRLVKRGNDDFKRSESEWEMEIRDSCQDIQCLRDAYRNRLVALNLAEEAEHESNAGVELPRPEVMSMPPAGDAMDPEAARSAESPLSMGMPSSGAGAPQ